MSQPEGFVDPNRASHVCRLKKSIYGLKQSPCCWNITRDEYLKSVGDPKSNADGYIYGCISFVILGMLMT